MASQTQYTHINQPSPSLSSPFDPKSFSLSAPSGTDIHARPPPQSRYIFTAPTSYHSPLRLVSFRSARISFTYTPALQYDHAGLVLALPAPSSPPSPEAPTAQNVSRQTAWVKAGLEVKDGVVYLSVVTKPANAWCDWSLHPIPTSATPADFPAELGRDAWTATIEFTRSKNALLVNHVANKGTGEVRTQLRKIPWVFLDGDEGVLQEGAAGGDGAGREAWIGAFAARPDPDGRAGDERLEVRFRDLEVESS